MKNYVASHQTMKDAISNLLPLARKVALESTVKMVEGAETSWFSIPASTCKGREPVATICFCRDTIFTPEEQLMTTVSNSNLITVSINSEKHWKQLKDSIRYVGILMESALEADKLWVSHRGEAFDFTIYKRE